MERIKIVKDHTFIEALQQRLSEEGPFSTWELFQLNYQAELTTMSQDFHTLHALKYLPHVEFFPHQINTAKYAIEQMSGRAILADEVGLGKTIEAGLILKEYMIRGLVKKALILVPASLVNQWVQELNEKFYIPAVPYEKHVSWTYHDIIVSSLDTAKRSPHHEEILSLSYDFVLVDEAHKLKNHRTKNYSFVRSIKKKYCLLLTATPIHNQLLDIFNLVSILKPGLLGNYEMFLKRFGNQKSSMIKDQYLKQLIEQVMIRHTRKNTKINMIDRNIQTVWLNLSEEEYNVYHELQTLTKHLPIFSQITYLREFCSSREACYLSLKKSIEKNEDRKSLIKPILEKIEQLPHHAKAKKVIELIQQIGKEKIIIFTQYRATQFYLQWFLQQHGISSVPFRGGFKRGKKDWMKQLFENHAQVLIATEAGSEGINLQFCRYLINYDLPWNPMKLEQRIGRIHRLGQKKDIFIYNLSLRQTIEEHVMHLLYKKINLFERIIGRLDDILERLNISNLEKELETIFAESESMGEAKIKIENLTSAIEEMDHHREEDLS